MVVLSAGVLRSRPCSGGMAASITVVVTLSGVVEDGGIDGAASACKEKTMNKASLQILLFSMVWLVSKARGRHIRGIYCPKDSTNICTRIKGCRDFIETRPWFSARHWNFWNGKVSAKGGPWPYKKRCHIYMWPSSSRTGSPGSFHTWRSASYLIFLQTLQFIFPQPYLYLTVPRVISPFL